jgi:hypothetical protein
MKHATADNKLNLKEVLLGPIWQELLELTGADLAYAFAVEKTGCLAK